MIKKMKNIMIILNSMLYKIDNNNCFNEFKNLPNKKLINRYKGYKLLLIIYIYNNKKG